MVEKNKQRVTLLSRKEVAAHSATGGGWGPSTVPRDKTLTVLGAHGIRDEADAILSACVDPLGRYLMTENFKNAQLSPAEVRKQARETAAVAEELHRRIQYMDPFLDGLVSGYAYRMNQIDFPNNGLDYLLRLQWVMRACEKDAEAWPSKVPKRTQARNELATTVMGILIQSVPAMTKDRAREIAAEILAAWGVALPVDERNKRRAVRAK